MVPGALWTPSGPIASCTCPGFRKGRLHPAGVGRLQGHPVVGTALPLCPFLCGACFWLLLRCRGPGGRSMVCVPRLTPLLKGREQGAPLGAGSGSAGQHWPLCVPGWLLCGGATGSGCFFCQFCWAGGGSGIVWRQLWGHDAGTGQWQRRGTQWGPHGERDFVGIGNALSIDPVMQIFLPASNAIINLICSVHEIKCFFEDEITLQGLF